MVATVFRDKYGQSETITGQAEEAGDLMTRTQQNDEMVSQSLTVIWREWKQVFLASGGSKRHPLPLVHSSIRLTPLRLSRSLTLHLPTSEIVPQTDRDRMK